MTDTTQPDLETLLCHTAFVRGLARALLRGDRHVDDVVQETWLAAVEAGPDRPGQERAWLSRVVRNVAYGTLRREGRRLRRETAAARSVAVPGTSEIAAREETRRNLLEHVLTVSEPSRSALLLRYYEGLPPREVAQSLGVPVETARTRIKRGLVELRRVLDAEHRGDRRSWMAGLLPLTGWTAPAGAGATVGTGALLAGGLVLLLGLGTFLLVRGDGGGAGPNQGIQSLTGPAPRLIARARPRAAVPVSRVGRSRIYGRVHRKGVGLPARVWIEGTAGAARALHTDAEGRFARDGLAAASHTIRIETEDGVSMRAAVQVLANGQHVRLDIDVPAPGHSLMGMAAWRSGKPFRGTVTCRLPSRGYWARRNVEPRLAVDCKDGHFRLAGLPDGPLVLLFAVNGGPSFRRTIERPHAGETLRVVVDDGLEYWQGTVEDSQGRPLTGIAFRATFFQAKAGVGCTHFVTSGAKGHLTFLVPTVGSSRLSCAERGYIQPDKWALESKTIRLIAGGRIHGVVRGPEGKPGGAGIRVRAVSMGTGMGRTGQFRRPIHTVDAVTTTTDDAGRYEVGLLPGRAFAFAAGDGMASPGIGALRRDAAVAFAKDLMPGGRVEHDLELVPAATLQGRLLDRQGQVVVGALIFLRRVPSAKTHRGTGLLPMYAASDSDGRFQLDVYPGFEVQAEARHPEFVRSDSAAFSLERGAAAEITLHMDRPRRVHVRVVDEASGEPIPGASVEVSRAKTWDWDFEVSGRSAPSDVEGLAELLCAPGGLGVRARARGYETDDNWKPLAASIEAGPFEARVTLRRGLQVAGRVFLPDGAPATKARVVMEPVAGTSAVWFPTGRGVDAEGRFSIKDKRHGTYRLTAWAQHEGQRHRAALVITDSNDAVELTLQSHGRQKGEWCVRVRDVDGRPAVASVALYASQLAGHGGSYGLGVRTVDGVAYVHSVSSKRFYVVVTPSLESGFGTALLGPFSSWEGGEYEVTLSPGRIVKGVVQGSDGAPAASLRLTAVPGVDDERAHVSQAVTRVARTDAQGRFTLRGLGRHPVRIRFQTQADGWTPPSIALDPDDDHPRLVLADHFEAVSLKVLDAGGHPAVQAYVEVFPANGELKAIATASSGADGIARVQGLDPLRTYRLLVWAFQQASHVDAMWSPEEATIRLPRALLTRGEVRTASGRVARRARVYRRGAFGRWRMVQEHPRMPFDLHLASGRHELVALTLDERPDEETTGSWIQAGATDVVLPFDPGPTLWMRLQPWAEGQFGSLEIQREGKALERPHRAHIARDGHSERYRLDAAARYSVFGRFGEDPEHAETYVYTTGLKTSEEDVALEVKPGHRLEGRISGGGREDYSGLVLYVHVGLHRIWGRIQPDGRFSVSGLPPAEVRVEVKAGYKDDTTLWSGQARTDVFADVRLD